jgi:hypothetical protein
MITMLRRLFWLALLGGAGYAVWTAWQHKQAQQPAAAPEWPPVDPPGPTPAESNEPAAATAGFAAVPTDDPAVVEPEAHTGATSGEAEPAPASDDRRWVDPLDDGSCPDGYPIKANDNSGIFHVPGGRFYARTGAERCYARAEDAEADGYRAAKS